MFVTHNNCKIYRIRVCLAEQIKQAPHKHKSRERKQQTETLGAASRTRGSIRIFIIYYKNYTLSTKPGPCTHTAHTARNICEHFRVGGVYLCGGIQTSRNNTHTHTHTLKSIRDKWYISTEGILVNIQIYYGIYNILIEYTAYFRFEKPARANPQRGRKNANRFARVLLPASFPHNIYATLLRWICSIGPRARFAVPGGETCIDWRESDFIRSKTVVVCIIKYLNSQIHPARSTVNPLASYYIYVL